MKRAVYTACVSLTTLGLIASFGGCPQAATNDAANANADNTNSTGSTNTNGNTNSTVLVGDAAAGQTKFTQSCVECHAASTVKAASGRVTTDMTAICRSSFSILLTEQEVADVKAYLESQ
ncbi:MAG: hypothetical protein HZB38_04330 [Planctomycetes bacterium]|nr:hypothetical protein [Planctomycetota bacterium]